MATLREIKIRIRSVKSTEKITKAMEMMAASKMKRAQQMALAGRPYLEKLSEVINNLDSVITQIKQTIITIQQKPLS